MNASAPGSRDRSAGSPPAEVARLLARVARPGRYVGGEFNLRPLRDDGPRVVLSYPDVYEVGISNPALSILHAHLSDATPAVVTRAYCPWPDMADLMRAAGVRLWQLETWEPVRTCDLWGFTLPHELTFTNVLEMLDLAGVPLRAAERGEGDPIVLGGGPAVANPWPLAPFFDAFFVGEAEARLDEIVAALQRPGRAARLRALAAVPGVWVPGQAAPALRQVFTGFSRTPPVTRPLVPVLEAVHDRAVVEVMRGCTAGCRFCQAGMWYRPVRERPVAMVVEAALRLLAETGCDEVSLMSLSSCDYSGIEEAVAAIREARPDVRVSLPSLRIDSAARSLASFAADQRGSVTLAPEAGTQELRDALNKGVSEEDLVAAVRAVFSGGFTGLKLYFMIGLPGERDEDVVAIARLAGAAARLAKEVARGRARLSLAVSTFVPKPHTPFQREPFAGLEVVRRRQALLHAALPRGVRAGFHDPEATLVEATLARGGPGCDRLVEEAWRRGARFDAWSDWFRLKPWQEAAAATGVALGEAGCDLSGPLPWEQAVDARLDAGFLAGERERARRGELTGDCRRGACSGCGVCAGEVAMEVLA